MEVPPRNCIARNSIRATCLFFLTRQHIMARIQAPRYFTSRKRQRGEVYVWQPPSAMGARGWKAIALNDLDGKPSPLAQAMAQAQWLNAIHDQVQSGHADVAQIIVDTWARRQSGTPFNLTPCPFVRYPVPGLDGRKLPAVPAARSFAALVADYQKSPGFDDIAPRTRQDYLRIMNDFLPVLGPEPVADLRRGRLQKLYQVLIRAHGKHSANARMRVLSVTLSHAVNLEWLDANPMTRFPLLSLEGRIVVPDALEIAALIRAAKTMPEGPRHDAVLLITAAADTGQRRGDLVESITLGDFLKGRVAFAQQKRGAFVNLPVMQEFMAAGEALIAALEPETGNLNTRFAELKLHARKHWFRHLADTPLIWSLKTRLPMDRYSATRLFARVRARASTAVPSVGRLRLSDFRDFMVTELLRAGCTDAEVAAITGHDEKSVGLKRKHYVDRHDPLITQNAIGKLEAWRSKQRKAS